MEDGSVEELGVEYLVLNLVLNCVLTHLMEPESRAEVSLLLEYP